MSQQTIENRLFNHYVLSKSEWIKNIALWRELYCIWNQ